MIFEWITHSADRSSIPSTVRFSQPGFLAGIVLFWALAANAQNLVLNGDFETGPHDPNSPITNWTVSGNGFVHTADEGATSGSFSAAFSIGGDSQGNILSQTINTETGQAYTVDFDSGIFGIRTGDPLQLNVQLLGSSTLLNRTITPPDALTFDPSGVIFGHYQFTFIAESSTTTLQFTDIGLGNEAADTLVDTVTILPTTILPPSTLPLVNGDFETGPYNVNGTVSGWLVSGAGRVAILPEGATSGNVSVAFSTGGDFQDDILSQRFFTTAGQQYTLDFDAAVYGVANSTQSLRVRVLGSASIVDLTVAPPYNGTFDNTQIQFHHYHYVFTADSTVTTLEFSDIGTGNSNADIVIDTVSVAPVPPSFTQWQTAHFTPDQLNDPQISGWAADPDSDGIPNGLEFFFNTDPLAGVTSSDAASLPRVAIEQFNSSPYATFTFRRLIGWNGTPAIVSVSDDLITWDDTGNQIELVSVTPSGDGITEIAKVRLTTPLDQGTVHRKFFRLKLTQ